MIDFRWELSTHPVDQTRLRVMTRLHAGAASLGIEARPSQAAAGSPAGGPKAAEHCNLQLMLSRLPLLTT